MPISSCTNDQKGGSMDIRTRFWLITYFALICVMLLCPFVLGVYGIMTLTTALIYGISALGLDLMWGKAGIVNFGNSVFFGVGAYSTALASLHIGGTHMGGDYVGLLLAILCSGGVAAIIGYFLLFGGVRGPYLAIVTLTLSVIANHLVIGWSSITGGNTGLLGIPPLEVSLLGHRIVFMGLPLYWLVVGLIVILLLAFWKIDRSHFGRVLAAVKMNEFRAESLGYRPSIYLWATFTVAAAVSGFAGALYAMSSGAVTPELVGLTLATDMLAWVAVGVRGTLIGPVIGAVVVILLQDQLSSISINAWPILLGCFFVLMTFLTHIRLRLVKVPFMDRLRNQRVYIAKDRGHD